MAAPELLRLDHVAPSPPAVEPKGRSSQRRGVRRRLTAAWITYDDGTVRPWGRVSDEEANALEPSHVAVTDGRGRPARLVKEGGDA